MWFCNFGGSPPVLVSVRSRHDPWETETLWQGLCLPSGWRQSSGSPQMGKAVWRGWKGDSWSSGLTSAEWWPLQICHRTGSSRQRRSHSFEHISLLEWSEEERNWEESWNPDHDGHRESVAYLKDSKRKTIMVKLIKENNRLRQTFLFMNTGCLSLKQDSRDQH